MTTKKDKLMDKLGALCERLDRVLEVLERLTGVYMPNPNKHDFPYPGDEPPFQIIQSLYGVKPRGTSGG